MDHAEFVKLWRAGTSAKEIASRFEVPVQSVYNYASKHRDECPSRHKKASAETEIVEEASEPMENETSEKENEESTETLVQENNERLSIEQILDDSFKEPECDFTVNDQSFDTVVIDTSAISSLQTFSIIEKAKHVIISSVVLREINKLKDTVNDIKLRHNFQKMLKDCALDFENRKYSIIDFLRQNNECNDETIARNAAEINEAVVITRDYGLCCFCKLYGVKYVLISNENIFTSKHESESNIAPFFLSRDRNKLTITCLMGTIEIKRGNVIKTLFINDKIQLFEDDYVTVKVKKESKFVVKFTKGKLVLKPI